MRLVAHPMTHENRLRRRLFLVNELFDKAITNAIFGAEILTGPNRLPGG